MIVNSNYIILSTYFIFYYYYYCYYYLQVLELGIVVHSVIIGISLGTSESPKTIKPLFDALTFHQFFEGMGLGGCISQVNEFYNTLSIQLQQYKGSASDVVYLI